MSASSASPILRKTVRKVQKVQETVKKIPMSKARSVWLPFNSKRAERSPEDAASAQTRQQHQVVCCICTWTQAQGRKSHVWFPAQAIDVTPVWKFSQANGRAERTPCDQEWTPPTNQKTGMPDASPFFKKQPSWSRRDPSSAWAEPRMIWDSDGGCSRSYIVLLWRHY